MVWPNIIGYRMSILCFDIPEPFVGQHGRHALIMYNLEHREQPSARTAADHLPA